MDHKGVKKITYIQGFLISIFLTLAAFYLVENDLLSDWGLVLAIVVLAVLQLGVQLTFFLHVNKEQKPRYSQMMLWFAMLVVVIIVYGSIWIMTNLMRYHSEPIPDNLKPETYIQQDEIINKDSLY